MINIGVLGTSGIAERRMIPAIRKDGTFRYAGTAYSTREEMGFQGTDGEFEPVLARKLEKAARFQSSFGGKIYEGYRSLLEDPGVEAVYIALPPALHFRWASEALRRGKHVLLEKPLTARGEDTEALVRLSREKNTALTENYGFPWHAQMKIIRGWLEEGAIGELRQVRASFGFPHRAADDFRYSRELGGGALLDCGGYTLRAAAEILGPDLEVLAASAGTAEGHEVDLWGNVLLRRGDGVCAVLSYGMDQDYRCELELWGSRGTVTASRIFTAPDGFPAPVRLHTAAGDEERTAADDQFLRMLQRFGRCMEEDAVREAEREQLLLQGRLTRRVRELGGLER